MQNKWKHSVNDTLFHCLIFHYRFVRRKDKEKNNVDNILYLRIKKKL